MEKNIINDMLLSSNYGKYFMGLRIHGSFNIVDAKLPNQWDISNVVAEINPSSKEVQTLISSEKEDSTIISLVGNKKIFTFDAILKKLSEMVKTNVDNEVKLKLYQEKINELKKVFDSANVEELSSIQIVRGTSIPTIPNNTISEEDEEKK